MDSAQRRASFSSKCSKTSDFQPDRRSTAATLLSMSILSTLKQKSSSETNEPSQWEVVMRKFSRDHKMGFNCSAQGKDIDRVTLETRPLTTFPTGSTYEGTWNALGLCGYGIYTFPNGVIYEGEFEDNAFHGEGEMRYPDGTKLSGKWVYGELVNRTIIFSDGVRYSDNNWTYCNPKDRRYPNELAEEGLQPAGQSWITKDKEPKKIPDGTYDVGDGIFHPRNGNVTDYEDHTHVIRCVDPKISSWIKENCRTSPNRSVGPVLGLYKQWVAPTLKPPAPPAPTCLADEQSDDFSEDPSFVSNRSANAWMPPKLRSNLSCARRSKMEHSVPVVSLDPVEVTIPLLEQVAESFRPMHNQTSKTSLMSQFGRLRDQLEELRNSTIGSIDE